MAKAMSPEVLALIESIKTLTTQVQAQQETINQLATKKSGKPAKEKPELPKRAPEPSTFKIPGPNGPFMVCCPDGWNSISDKTAPPDDAVIPVNAVNYETKQPEVRYYMAGKRGWTRNKKGTGWIALFPKRIPAEEVEVAA